MTAGTLLVVATPLGHLGDLSPRAAEALRTASLVAAEDTRRVRTLLQHAAARPRVLSFHAHSPPGRLAAILAALDEGATVALVTDAGTPTVSDPGADLVAAARARGHAVLAVPGPSAVTAALSISGLPADRYAFFGFLPRRGRDRETLLAQVAAATVTVVLFEAAPRLAQLLADVGRVAGGDRRVAVARELTKVHEEVRVGTVAELAGYYASHEPRGELTVVVSGAPPTDATPADPRAAAARARALLAAGTTRRDVVGRLVAEFGLSRNEAYRLVTDL